MNAILILVSVLAFACSSFGTRLFQTRFRNAARRLPLFQMAYCLVSTLCFWSAGGFALPTLETVLYGLAFGALFYVAVRMSARGYVLGSMALTSVIVNMSLLLPILYSIVFLDESLTVLHAVGFLFFTASVAFSAFSAGADSKKINLPWLLTVLLGFAANGLTAIIQKNYVLHAKSLQDSVFLAVAYLTAALAFAVTYLAQREKKSDSPEPPEESAPAKKLDGWLPFLFTAVLAGAGSFGGNLLLGRLSALVLAAILYPCINGGLAVVTTLFSFCFFREKPTWQKVLSVLLGCVAIVVLNLG